VQGGTVGDKVTIDLHPERGQKQVTVTLAEAA
jgi:hypothetical protein